MKEINIDGITIGNGRPFVLIAGPCVIESEAFALRMARRLKELCAALDVPLIFKASYDKANRSSVNSYRGPGIAVGLRVLREVRENIGLPVISDVHSVQEIERLAGTLDVIQIPAFLCRQTDIVLAAAKTGKCVNVKKGQFLAPWDVRNIVDKMLSVGNSNILITERGSMFGYNNLVVDFKGLPIIRAFGYPVCFDATHSVQLPGGAGTSSGGQREFVAHLVRAGVAVGIDALFLEVHENPDEAMSDGPNMVDFTELESILKNAKAIDNLVKRKGML